MNPQAFLTSVAITVGLAFGAHWDDETFLGRGPMIGAGLSVPIGRHVSVEGDVGWATHHRDSGYLAVDGTPVTVAGRLILAFRDPAAKVRPFISGGLAWWTSTTHFKFAPLVAGPTGMPVVGRAERADYKTSLGAWEVGTGVVIRASDRLSIRPEGRWMFTASDPNFKPGSLEPPIFVIRGGVTLAWRLK